MSKITIGLHGMHFKAAVGVYDWEKEGKRSFVIDVEISLEADKPDFNDYIGNTLNYEELVEIIEEKSALTFNLIESLLEEISSAIWEGFPEIIAMKIRLYKPNPIPDKQINSTFIEREFCR